MVTEDAPPIWEAFCTALGTEYRKAQEITGASGISHPVEAIGVDDKGKRLVLVSGEYNPRIAALLRVDVQATMKDVRVLVARPLALDLAHTARKMFFTDEGVLDMQSVIQLSKMSELGDRAQDFMKEAYGPPATALLNSMSKSKLPVRSHILNLVEQLTSLDWPQMMKPAKEQHLLQAAVNILTKFSTMDNLAADRSQGICPIPTYELTDADWELFQNLKHIEEVQVRLREMNIYQYFYPPADSLALGLIDNGIATQSQIANGVAIAEAQGHQVSKNALLADVTDFHELAEQLKANGYAMEGEFAMELTEEGKLFRQSVNIRPSESLFQKLSRLMSVKVNIDFKDLFYR